MVDQDLRGLARAAAAGDASACVAWARALERLGRRDEAVGAYLAALDRDTAAAVEARAALAALAALPTWAGAQGDAGRSGALDVEPLRVAPARLWHVPPSRPREPNLGRTSEPYLLGGWAGLVAVHPAPARIEALDMRDGRVLWSARGWWDPMSSHVRGDVVVLRGREGTTARDLRTGEALATVPRGEARVSGWCPTLELRASMAPGLWRLDAFDWPDPRVPPALAAPRWSLVRAREQRARALITAGELVVLAFADGEVAAFDLASGEERWRTPGADPRGDAEGVTLRRGHSEALVDASGQERWTSPSQDVLTVGRERVVVAPHAGFGVRPPLRVLDRATASVAATLVTHGPVLACAQARDVLYVAGARGLDVYTLTGERLWRLEPDDLPGRVPVALLPLERRLVVGMRSGDLVCLVEPGRDDPHDGGARA